MAGFEGISVHKENENQKNRKIRANSVHQKNESENSLLTH